jgi:hypothetical protein
MGSVVPSPTVAALLGLGLALAGCSVVSTAADVAGTAVSTAADVTGTVVETTVDTVSGGGDDEE